MTASTSAMGPKGDVAAFSGHVCFTPRKRPFRRVYEHTPWLFRLSMIFSENRCRLFRTMLYGECAARSDGFAHARTS